MARATGKSEAVYERLKGDIESLRMRPGAKLSEVQLGEELGASRTPVREAIRRLAREGLVDFVPGEVARVAAISLGGVRALFEFRMLLEPRAVASVTTAGSADERVLAPFRELLERLEVFDESFRALDSAAQAGSYQEFYDITEAFDQAVIAACRNPYLARTIRDLRSQTVRLRHLSHSGPRRMLTSLEEHRAMLKAVTHGDAQAAEAACRHHLAQTLQALIDSLTSQDLTLGTDVSLDVAG
ncbi:GntR family transcriptional regulator [Streptomyces ipomoeae]|jgi:DNA-binding GntR family transcriptional regulator|uniref:Transcriptional regulator, GntR family n=2 Tax=Streptomyces ipomoeae TaxID=103232 RepID=L1KJT7_9ACTN|nr:GntR family transcriptional regulator [Streptomyces ipomoeae]EKX61086.1 transcriptional regulator, GntR family [Streptomyces ipomoeae 91-03]MDX2696341.1 GntR family transcriptional regulator [Streptomyces ipomoeae]MDX2822672.1 GntR family transcriptional regulator [Streptomyces ipomoeae]MDX2842075.1 GntR family transcriptional regulator [Streptomyces ipomoeae]MDX2875552.1 GntR family transcriptional regulator [Streptomyces ipomoeae]